jgi:hypothetical protein
MDIKKMIGNSPSILSRFVTIYKAMKLNEYISIFPEHYNYFYYYQSMLNNYIYVLESYYHHIYNLKNSVNTYFSKEKPHHVNMVYHLKNIHKKCINVVDYVNQMDESNLYYAIKQYYQFMNEHA